MIHAIMVILMALTGYSDADMIGKNPQDFGAQYDVAKQIHYAQTDDKDGGNIDSLSGN